MYTYKHVIIVGIDGAGMFYRNANTPTISSIAEKGAITDMCLTAIPTDSAQCWGSMLMGVTCRLHGLHNDKLSESPVTLATEEHPTLYRMIRKAYPDAVMGCFSNWRPIITGLLDDDRTATATCDDEELCDRICTYIKSEKPNFLFIQLDSVDGAGHAHGYGSERHLRQISICDEYTGRIYKAAEEAGMIEDTLFIVTTDHGGYGCGHGTDTDEEKWIFVALDGKTVNHTRIPFMQVKDIPAIVTHALGVPDDPNWQSRLPEGLFAE